MEIAKGKSRTVFVFKKFVLKFARIRLRDTIKTLRYGYEMGRLIKYLNYSIDVYVSPKRTLFLGIRDNWQEFVFYVFNRSPFLAPTYFSLFGLLNVQKRGEKPKIKDVDLWCQLCDMTNKAVHVDGHSFSNSHNFCECDGHLMIVDYGDPRIHGVLKKHGEKIYHDFDFSYVYAERIKNKDQ
jgi:hypothetical protein